MTAATPAHVLVYATSFAMVAICTGLALGGGANSLTIVTIRTLGVVALFFAYFRIAGVGFAMPARDTRIGIGIGFVVALTNYAVNESLAHIPVPLAILVFYLWPAIASAASWLLGKERFRWRSALGLALAFAGVGLALDVEFTAAQQVGIALALLGACTWSATFLLVGHFFLGRDTRPVTFTMTATAAVIFVVVTALTRDVMLPGSAAGWSGIAGVPLFYAFAMIGLFAATVTIGPAKTGFFMNFEPIATVLLSALILGQNLEPIQLAGAALVVGALFLFRPLK